MTKHINTLLVTKGHPFEREAFFKMIDALKTPKADVEINWTHVEHPAAEAVLTPQNAAPFDVIVFYDMPGVIFTHSEPRFETYEPSEAYKQNFLALLDQGKPMVFLHHAIAGWPTWDEYAHIIGGRFHFLPGKLKGKTYPGSGYRFRVPQNITVLDETHPIVNDLPATFPIRDETYLMPVLEDEVTPLLRSDFTFTADKFHFGGENFKDHEEGSNLVGWTKTYKKSPIAYLQFGHEDTAYSDPYYQKLISNAIQWAEAQEAATKA